MGMNRETKMTVQIYIDRGVGPEHFRFIEFKTINGYLNIDDVAERSDQYCQWYSRRSGFPTTFTIRN
jgi:hypothetical protein